MRVRTLLQALCTKQKKMIASLEETLLQSNCDFTKRLADIAQQLSKQRAEQSKALADLQERSDDLVLELSCAHPAAPCPDCCLLVCPPGQAARSASYGR